MLKGPTDIISNGNVTYLCEKNTPAMTVGGTGDVLSGLVAGLLSNNRNCLESAAAASFICSLAGKEIQSKLGLHITSMDLIDELPNVMKSFDKIPCLYIADGHHRSASSALLASNRNKGSEEKVGNKDYFLACFIDEKELNILEFNRLVKGINGLSKKEFLDKTSPFFDISKLTKPSKPSKVHEMTVCIEGDWYLFIFKPHIIKEKHPVDSLDPEILTKFVLDPILGIKDLKTDTRIEFISGAESIDKINEQINKKKFDVGFVLFPVSMDQVKDVADNNMIMPPKSTWVEPKLRSGLTIYNINE